MNRRPLNWSHKHSLYFPHTQWKYFEGTCNSPEAKKAGIIHFAEQYWNPLYSYLVAKGYNEANAGDLVQGFIVDKIMTGRFLHKADHKRGRFRNMLLKALNNYIIDMYRSHKQDTTHTCRSFDDREEEYSYVGGISDSPEQIYNRTWAQTLISEVLHLVVQQSIHDKHYWDIFQDRILSPIIDDTKPLSIPELCKKYNISSPVKISNILATMKRRFRQRLEEFVKRYDQDVPEEIGNMITSLSI
jgi:hypothetical protein